MPIVCPNVNHPDWIRLAARVGRRPALMYFTLNNFQIPTARQESLDALGTRLREFLEALGFSIEEATSLRGLDGQPLPLLGSVDLLEQVVRVTETGDVDTLSEEAGHVIENMLKASKSPLWTSMMGEITQYQVYQDVVDTYKDLPTYTPEKLKREAVGKLIGRVLVGDAKGEVPTEPRLERAQRWWNRVLDWLRGLFTQHRRELEAFRQAAKLVDDDLTNLRFQPERETFYRAQPVAPTPSEKARSIIDRANKNSEEFLWDWRETGPNALDPPAPPGEPDVPRLWRYEMGREVGDERRTEVKRTFDQRSGSREAKLPPPKLHVEGARAIIRERMGEYLRYAQDVKRGVENPQPPKLRAYESWATTNLHDGMRNLAADLVEKYPNAHFKTNVYLYDEVEGEGGSIDILAIEDDGTVHPIDLGVYDGYAEQQKEKAGEAADVQPLWRRQAWSAQLAAKRAVLKRTFPVTAIEGGRTIPVEVTFKKRGDSYAVQAVTSYSSFTDPDTGENRAPARLRAMLAGLESTGNLGLDKLLLRLREQSDELKQALRQRGLDEETRARYKREIDQLDAAFRDAELRLGFDAFVKYFDEQVEYVNRFDFRRLQKPADPTSDEAKLRGFWLADLRRVYQRMLDWGQLRKERYFDVFLENAGSDEELQRRQQKLSQMLNLAQDVAGKIERHLVDYAQELVEEGGVKHLGQYIAQGWWGKWMRSISGSKNQYIQAFYKLVQPRLAHV